MEILTVHGGYKRIAGLEVLSFDHEEFLLPAQEAWSALIGKMVLKLWGCLGF